MIPADLAPLLAPLERFDAIHRRAVRLGSRLADLSYANPYAGIQDSARSAIRTALDDDRPLSLQYSPFGGQTMARRVVADALTATHELAFAYDDVILTPGAMAALHLSLRTAGEPGDEVVVPVPCWLDYPLYVRALGLVPVFLPLEPPTFSLDAEALRSKLSPRTCALLLSHPANPTGRNYTEAELRRLALVIVDAERRLGCRITTIADETHRDFAEDGTYRSLVRFLPRCVVVYSFGKYHFMQGQRLGYAAVSPEHPDRSAVSGEMVRWTRITGMGPPTSLMQRAVPRLVALRHDLQWLQIWRRRMVDELSGSGFRLVPPDATFFLYVETPQPYDDFEFVEMLASEGVLVMPAPLFHHRGYVRMSLTGTEDMMQRAITVLRRFAPSVHVAASR